MKKDIFERLFKAAEAARRHAHAPVSHFSVGAAFLTETGNVYAGANFEEGAFLSNVHAEQGAISQMVAREGRAKITHLVVVGGKADDATVCAPCGHCRQVLLEFADGDLKIAAAGPGGDIRLETTLDALLPHAFRLSAFK